MSTYEKFQQAIEEFEPGASNTRIVQTQTELNEKTFTALAGRKLKLWTGNTTKTILSCGLVWLATAILVALLTSGAAGGAYTGMWIGLMVIFLFRSTLLTVSDGGLNIYFLEIRLTSAKFVVSDKLTLPFDQMINVSVKTGQVFKNTQITMDFLLDGKPRKVKLTAPHRARKAPEHDENLQALLNMLQAKFAEK
ncbi:MAG: hypothetical protein FWD06_04505 [Oscillospiraceae bacterium]|nr:hypothetical protein [Oscillospiraceae bacterium]